MIGRLLTRRSIPALVAALTLGLAGTANATTATVDASGNLTVTGDASANLISIYKIASDSDGTQHIIVKDGDAATADPSCMQDPQCQLAALTNPGNVVSPGANCTVEAGDTHSLMCTPPKTGPLGPAAADGKFATVAVNLLAGNDIFNEYANQTDDHTPARATSPVGVPVTVDAGDGDDTVFGSLGQDTITGGAGDDDLRGNTGDDLIKPNAGSNKVQGGDGTDTVDYSTEAAGRAISLDNLPDDGTGCTLDSTHMGNACAKENVRSDVENITTGAGNDLISAGPGVNVITTGAGNDLIFGGGGNDTIDAGADANEIHGDFGTYTSPNSGLALAMPSGDTTAAGDDTISSGDQNDVIDAGAGNDKVKAGNGDNNITLGDGADGPMNATTKMAGTGNDTITGGNGADTITDGGGNNPLVTGGADNDTIDLSAGTGTNPDVEGNDGDDTITGGGGADTIDAGAGNDKVSAGNGTNNITLGAGDDGPVTAGQKVAGTDADTISGGDGVDNITDGGGNNPLITGGAGGDTIDVTGGNNAEIDGDADNDTITTGAGNDFVYGGHKDQAASTDDGSDTINTNGGNDYVVGGSGADYMNVGSETDTISYEEKSDPVWAVVVPPGGTTGGSGTYCNPYATPPAGKTCEGDTVIAAENLRGGSAGDVLAGDQLVMVGGVLKCTTSSPNNLANDLRGNAGDDQLFGCAANDVLFGDAGDDNLVGGTESDDINGGDGGETNGDSVSYQDYVPASGNNGVTVTLGDGAFNDGPTDGPATQLDNLHGDIENVTGSDSKDVLIGSGQGNTLNGLGQDDQLDGGFGPDKLIGGDGSDTVTYNGTKVGATQVTSARTTAIVATLDGAADDGQAGENDNLDPTVENVIGGSGDDTFVGQPIGSAVNANADNVFTGNDGRDSFDGKYGADTFKGGDGEDTVLYSGRGATEVITAEIDGNPHSGSVNDRNTSQQLDKIDVDIENLTGGSEPDVFTGDQKANILSGGDGTDTLDAQAGDDKVLGGTGDDNLDGGAGIDRIQGGLGNDVIAGSGGTDTVDYTDRSTPVTVTLDNNANDGEVSINEADNVLSDIENCDGCTTASGDGLQGNNPPPPPPAQDPGPGPQPEPQPGPLPQDNSQNNNQNQNNTTTDTTTDTTTTKVDPKTEQRDPGTTSSSTVQDSSMQTSVSVTKAVKGVRSVLVRGRILVKARNGVAKASASCKGGGKVLVTIRKGSKVVGKKLVKVTKTCTFLAPVTLKKGTAGKLKVEVKFLGNRALKATKRTTSLQVNG
jgi:Ca2+-binding RTX toxin-like protein